MNHERNQPKRVRLSRNFFLDEFQCNCGSCDFENLIDGLFVVKLQNIREDVGKPFKLNSAARCEEHNRLVGGYPGSAHLVTKDKPARAVDISTVGWTGEERYLLIKSAIKYGIRGIGIAKTFIHIDTKKRRAVWGY